MNPLNLPKLCGGDIELGNFLTGVDSSERTGRQAAMAVLGKIRGVASGSRASHADSGCDCEICCARRAREWLSGRGSSVGSSGEAAYDPQDWMRNFLPENGGCIYIDLDHIEVCLPEVLSARDHVAAWNAMLRIAARAQREVNAELPVGQKVHVLANNVDGHGNSHGSHLDFLLTRRAWDNIFHRRLQQLLFLAAYQASSMVFTGQGGVVRDGGAAGYAISQRAAFVEVLAAVQTTFKRPIVNSRDEALCGTASVAVNSPARTMARLHVIFYDSTLCHVASLLKVGVMQIVLAMIEAERINQRLILEDPVAAVHAWSSDPTLGERAELADGRRLTAVELQMLFLDDARAFVESGACEGIVPEAETILALWADTLEKLRTRDFASLARRVDWVLKLSLLQRVMKQRPSLGWASPEIQHLDHLYSALDGGLYQACEAQGAVERVVSDDGIERFLREPPHDTRAYTRSRLLRLAGPEQVEHVDWDEITFRLRDGWPFRRTVSLANPLGFSRDKVRFLETASLDDALDILGAEPRAAGAPATSISRPAPRRVITQPTRPPRP
jgi:proteasome accessory factor A